MNTPINFETAKLLKEKGFRILSDFESSYPTIAEVVMWLYEKHGVWISTKGDDNKTFKYELHVWNWYEPEKTFRQGHVSFGNGVWDTDSEPFNSPTETYEAAIEYTLNNLI